MNLTYSISHVELSHYLEHKGWHKTLSNRPALDIFCEPDQENPIEIPVPNKESSKAYAALIYDAVQILARIENRPEQSVIRAIRSVDKNFYLINYRIGLNSKLESNYKKNSIATFFQTMENENAAPVDSFAWLYENLGADMRHDQHFIGIIAIIISELYSRLFYRSNEKGEGLDKFNHAFFSKYLLPILASLVSKIQTSEMQIEHFYDLFVTIIAQIAKQITCSNLSSLFLTCDQKFLEAAKILKSERAIDQIDYSSIDWIKRISESIAKNIDHVSNDFLGTLIDSRNLYYRLEWDESNRTKDQIQNKETVNNQGGRDSIEAVYYAENSSHRCGITAYIAINYLQFLNQPANLNLIDIFNHPAHLGKWDKIIWPENKPKVLSLLITPIVSMTKRDQELPDSTKSKGNITFIGVLKVESPQITTNDGRYFRADENKISSFAKEIGYFFGEYDKNKQIIDVLWSGHVLQRISQRTAQINTLLDKGVPLQSVFAKVAGYLSTNLRLIYGADEAIHFITGHKKLNDIQANCHILDAFYPEYENRIRFMLDNTQFLNCEKRMGFIHCRVVDNDSAFQGFTISDLLSNELGVNELSVRGKITPEIMQIPDFIVWNDSISSENSEEKLYQVTFEFLPHLSRKRLLDSIGARKDLTDFCLPQNREPIKVIVNHSQCNDPKLRCALCKARKGTHSWYPPYYTGRCLVFRLCTNHYDLGKIMLFFNDADTNSIKNTKIDIVRNYRQDIIRELLNSVRISGEFFESEFGDIRKVYLPTHCKSRDIKSIAVLNASIYGFSSLVESLLYQNKNDFLEDFVNEYYKKMETIIEKYGRLFNFIEDDLLALFGENETNNPQRCILSAVFCAFEMTDEFSKFSLNWIRNMNQNGVNYKSISQLSMIIGISFGRVQFGYFGRGINKKYMPFGDPISLAQKLKTSANSVVNEERLGGIVMSKMAYDYLAEYIKTVENPNPKLYSIPDNDQISNYLAYCPNKIDFDHTKIIRELNIEL
jgi:class 3 adenylate cyclase